MFSKACEYGIRALTVIAKAGKNGEKIGMKKLCLAANTPEPFTAKILQNLVKKKIIHSQKGPAGGFYITKDLNQISLYEIVEAIDGNELFIKCGLGMDECNAKKPCPFHFQFEELRNKLNEICRNNTLGDLLEGFHVGVFKN